VTVLDTKGAAQFATLSIRSLDEQAQNSRDPLDKVQEHADPTTQIPVLPPDCRQPKNQRATPADRGADSIHGAPGEFFNL
jgi:hypothetical protein